MSYKLLNSVSFFSLNEKNIYELSCVECFRRPLQTDCISPKFIWWSLNPQGWYLEVGSSRSNYGGKMEPSWIGLVPLWGTREPTSCLSAMWDFTKKMAICRPGSRPHQTPGLSALWCWMLQSPELRLRSSYLSHPVYDVLVIEPWTKTAA